MTLCMLCRFSLTLFVAHSALTGCLPADTRPEPGTVASGVVGEDALRTGFVTSDGWEVVFDEFLISLGEIALQGDDCNPYAESDYLRILDMQQPGVQRLNLMHALGGCEFSFLLEDPDSEAVLGSGVDDSDKALMRTAGSDPFVEQRGIALYVVGRAARASDRYRFEWSFRHSLEYTDCGVVEFDSGVSDEVEIHVRGRVLFQESLEEDALLRFDAYAAADGDGDRDVTLEELNRVSLPVGDDYSTLGEQLYLGLAPEVPRFRDTSACRAIEPQDDGP